MTERITQIIDYLDISVRAFEKSIGAGNGMINKAKSQKRAISTKWITKISDVYPQINNSWILTGEGQMIVDRINSTGLSENVELMKRAEKEIERLNSIIDNQNILIEMLKEKK